MWSCRYDQYEDAWDTSVSVEIDGETIRYFHTFVKGVHRVWVDHPLFLAKVSLKQRVLGGLRGLQAVYHTRDTQHQSKR